MNDKVKYTLILNLLPDSPYAPLFDSICQKIERHDGTVLYYLQCYDVDVSHPLLLSVECPKYERAVQSEGPHSDAQGHGDVSIQPEVRRYRIPYSLVLLISDYSLDATRIGFQS